MFLKALLLSEGSSVSASTRTGQRVVPEAAHEPASPSLRDHLGPGNVECPLSQLRQGKALSLKAWTDTDGWEGYLSIKNGGNFSHLESRPGISVSLVWRVAVWRLPGRLLASVVFLSLHAGRPQHPEVSSWIEPQAGTWAPVPGLRDLSCVMGLGPPWTGGRRGR